jgi:hypothetical protein
MTPGHAESGHCFRQATPIERHLFVGLAAPLWPRAVASPCWRIQYRTPVVALYPVWLGPVTRLPGLIRPSIRSLQFLAVLLRGGNLGAGLTSKWVS